MSCNQLCELLKRYESNREFYLTEHYNETADDIILTKDIFLVCKEITPLIKHLVDKLSRVK